jgi:hypothetical protein
VNGVAIPSQVYAEVAAGGTIPNFPEPFDSLLFTSGSFLFLDGGSLDLGLVRDSELNSRNRYRQAGRRSRARRTGEWSRCGHPGAVPQGSQPAAPGPAERLHSRRPIPRHRSGGVAALTQPQPPLPLRQHPDPMATTELIHHLFDAARGSIFDHQGDFAQPCIQACNACSSCLG